MRQNRKNSMNMLRQPLKRIFSETILADKLKKCQKNFQKVGIFRMTSLKEEYGKIGKKLRITVDFILRCFF